MSADHRVEAWVKLHTPRRVYPTAEHHEVLTKRAEATLRVLDAADREQGIHRVKVDDATVERCAEAAALVDDLDGCFEHIREWEALEEWEQEAQGYPSGDYESRADWIKRTRAVLAALTGAES